MLLKPLRVAAAAAVVGLSLLTPQAQAADTKSVKITAIVEHPALDAVRKGVIEELAAQGFKEGENLEVEFQSAQGDVGIAGQIAKKFVGDSPDAIVAIATPSAQAAVAAARGRIPVVFSAVTDPVGAKLIQEEGKSTATVTGVSDLTPVAKHLALVQEIVPGAKTIGIVHNPGEANAVVLVDLAKKAAPDLGLEVIVASAPTSGDVLQATRSLVGKADAVYIPTDNTVISALEAVLKVGEEAKLPVFAGDTDSVNRGAAAAAGFDYYDVGRQTGAQVAKILQGTKPADIPVEGVETMKLAVNPAAAARMGVTLPQPLVDRAETVVK
ncbi:ABC transporter substrate-binding protein [Caenispirillum bisanense]|uniref:Putative ABC transport system substrate-binding protein n=1 Tax=Caenispirillum bisanense TaxID=414052 RepID=A0A286GXR9_9PROT|nr:ABC transporter substrate-binding protein [Caenispirillum bisanense]SOD99976.1 putative ABC transport system substrate-binding protein [Caenispirillum bisanense]